MRSIAPISLPKPDATQQLVVSGTFQDAYLVLQTHTATAETSFVNHVAQILQQMQRALAAIATLAIT